MICRKDGSACYNAYVWTSSDGRLEAFWYEDGQRVTKFFEPNGEQVGSWKQYVLK